MPRRLRLPRTLLSPQSSVLSPHRSEAMSAQEVVGYEVRDRVALITIRRPDKANAINEQVALDLQAAWQRFEAGDERVGGRSPARETAPSPRGPT